MVLIAYYTYEFRYTRNKQISWKTLVEKAGMSEKDAFELASLMNNNHYKVFELVYIGDPDAKWLIKREGVGIPGGSFKTKKEALNKVEKFIDGYEPAVFVKYYQNDNIQDYKEYTSSDIGL